MIRPTRPSLLAFVLLFALVLPVVACSGDDDNAQVTIGALLPLTGALSSYGETSKAALDEAVAVTNHDTAKELRLLVEDTKTEPATALAKLKSLKSKGVRLVVGPYSSSEAKEVKDYADQNGIVLISPLSTARSLAIPGDNLFRFTPDDAQEGLAVAALAFADGVRVMVPISRDDEGNLGLQSAMKTSFEAAGGRVLPVIKYAADEKDFADEVKNVAAAVAGAGTQPQAVGVYLTAFAEVTALFAAASSGPDAAALRSVRWYGSDSVALSKGLVEDRTAAAFASQAGYPNPILGLSERDRSVWSPVSETVAQKLGREPDAFALAAYDALTVAYRASKAAGRDGDLLKLKSELVQIADGFSGLTGPTVLNGAGDRAIGNYDFWSVCAAGDRYAWKLAATYTAAERGPAQVERRSC